MCTMRTTPIVLLTAIALTAITAILSGAPAFAQGTSQPTSLEKSCDDIKMVFEYAKFTGDYKTRVTAFLAGGCKTAVPIPADTHNIPRFNTAAEILQNGAGIHLTR
ncbi:MAG: hypothetical protein QOJ84_3782 [Bradyrhizobium sp.]|jgi:hypothetical protein|nr:hypothetical protein [Bradyrhizobium sp.]